MLHFLRPTKQFFKDYRLPLEATIILIVIVLFMLFTRTFERLALADVLGSNTDSSSDYATLLSNDKSDEIKKNDVGTQEETKVATNSNTNTSTPFTVSPNAPPPEDPPEETGGGEPEPTPPFSAEIDGPLVLEGSVVECSGNGTTQECSRRYIFRAKVFAQNGPGLIKFAWQGSVGEAIEQGSFSVGSGETYTPLHKEISLRCSQPQMIHLMLTLSEPNTDQSEILQHYHSCSTVPPPLP